jgi:cell division protein FtsQ
MKSLPPPKMPDRPGRWKLLVRRQRRLLRPAALASILLVGAVAVLGIVHLIGRGPSLQDRIAAVAADLGMRVEHIDIEGQQKTPEAQLRGALGVKAGQPTPAPASRR